MIKRIMDLTVDELMDICHETEICDNCPFSHFCTHEVAEWPRIVDLTLEVEVLEQ